ncbi:MAG: type II toxin-antitoxin system RelE/ParE family toxin [Clostridiales Family XIII bacterium]|jgi:hypothetical protein|nr:type II toxin-antitoxin system RelE/ParE family toxin [Clostridiales Family XIII bacterium]
MAIVRYSDSANVDFIAALKSIRLYFAEKEAIELGEKHIELFKAGLKKQEELLAVSPELYPIRREYDSSRFGRIYRSFNVHWFIVFYTYENSEGVVIWFIRSAKSDYSNIIMLS